jgi:hypothetical protein
MGKDNEIRLIAYALWVRDGKCHGNAVSHWLRAEAIWEFNQKVFQETTRKSDTLVGAGIPGNFEYK